MIAVQILGFLLLAWIVLEFVFGAFDFVMKYRADLWGITLLIVGTWGLYAWLGPGALLVGLILLVIASAWRPRKGP